jgi:transcriptional regulator with XRE-family HTH domain
MDLKRFRERAFMSQADLAKLLGVEQSQISRWEKGEGPPPDMIEKLSEKMGADFNRLFEYKEEVPEPLDIENTWKIPDCTEKALLKYIDDSLKRRNIPEDLRKKYIEGLPEGIKEAAKKPTVVVPGHSDTGKTHIINWCTGTNAMEADYSPVTSLVVIVKHIKDKPKHCGEANVHIFRDQCDGETMWDARRIDDEAYFQKWLIASGGFETLRAYGTHDGESRDKHAGSALVFLDAPILEVCDIIDIPGFGTGNNQDDELGYSAMKNADVFVYLSIANGFMRGDDIEYLKRMMKAMPVWEKQGENELKPLCNLFIVASQAQAVDNGNVAKLERNLNKGCDRLFRALPGKYWHDRKALSGYPAERYGQECLRSRFFAFTTNSPEIREGFLNDFKPLLEALPKIVDSRIKAFVKAYAASRKPDISDEIQECMKLLDERENYRTLLRDIDDNELNRVQETDKLKKEFREKIHELREKSMQEFTQYTRSVINTDYLEQLLKERDVKGSKEDLEVFFSYLSSTIQEKLDDILTRKSEVFSKKVTKFIADYSALTSRPQEAHSVNIGFDATREFMEILAKILKFIGVGAFAFGAGSFVWSFAAAVGGAAFYFALPGLGLLPAGAALFGPIGLVAGLLLVGLALLINLIGISWRKSAAKKIVAAFDENEILKKYIQAIRSFWKQTETAFDQAAEGMENEYLARIENLRNLVENYDDGEINQKIAQLRELADFFERIPLQDGGSQATQQPDNQEVMSC